MNEEQKMLANVERLHERFQELKLKFDSDDKASVRQQTYRLVLDELLRLLPGTFSVQIPFEAGKLLTAMTTAEKALGEATSALATIAMHLKPEDAEPKLAHFHIGKEAVESGKCEQCEPEKEKPEVWLENLFEFDYCDECGHDAACHTVCITALGTYFAKCDKEPRKYGDTTCRKCGSNCQV